MTSNISTVMQGVQTFLATNHLGNTRFGNTDRTSGWHTLWGY